MFTPSCNSLLIELNDGDFSFIADTKNNTAIVRFIYIPAYQKKDILVPEYVTDYHGDKFFVKEIRENAVKNIIQESGVIEYSSDVLISLQLKGVKSRDFDVIEAKRDFKA